MDFWGCLFKFMNDKNTKTALAILQDEIRGDMEAALKKMDPKYSMTWVYKHPKNGTLFPRVSNKQIKEAMKDVYEVKGRTYDIKNVATGKNLVIIELIESYNKYRTPLVLVLEFRDGKIIRGRHYCDPNLSYLELSTQDLKKIYR